MADPYFEWQTLQPGLAWRVYGRRGTHPWGFWQPSFAPPVSGNLEVLGTLN
jgi:hypothetical protein